MQGTQEQVPEVAGVCVEMDLKDEPCEIAHSQEGFQVQRLAERNKWYSTGGFRNWSPYLGIAPKDNRNKQQEL